MTNDNLIPFVILGLLIIGGLMLINPTAIVVEGNETQQVNITYPLNREGTALVVEEFRYEVALGHVNGDTTWNKWGYNDDVDTTATETVWAVGGELVYQETPFLLNLSSTDVDDTMGGTGANSVVIYGVNQNREAVIDVVTLNGTNTVQSNLEFLGINRIAVYLGGSSGWNEGALTGITNTTGDVQAYVPAEQGTTQQAFYFVSANHTFLADWLWIHANKLSGGSTPKMTIKGYVHSFVSDSTYEVFRTVLDTGTENTEELRPSQPFVIGESSILYFTADSDTNNAEVIVRFSGVEVRE